MLTALDSVNEFSGCRKSQFECCQEKIVKEKNRTRLERRDDTNQKERR